MDRTRTSQPTVYTAEEIDSLPGSLVGVLSIRDMVGVLVDDLRDDQEI